MPTNLKSAIFATAVLGATAANAKTIFVNAAMPNGGDGSTWEQAFSYLQGALDVALPGDNIFLAKGTYFPDDGIPNGFGDREISFTLNQVNLYGGFLGGETSFDQRNPEAHETILSGEIWELTPQTPGYERYWSLHVVVVSGASRIDGLTIQRGRANGEADPYNKGGGVLVATGQTVTLVDCVLRENHAAQSGGAVSGKVMATSSIFSDNEVDNQYMKPAANPFPRWLFDPFCSGGAIDGETSATSCKFLRNVVNARHLDNGFESSATGGAISGPDVRVTNCDFDANEANSYSISSGNPVGTSLAFSRGGAISGATIATQTTFTNNVASSSSSSATSPNAQAIVHNKSHPESRGGAIAGESHLMNCVFDSNSSLADAPSGDESDLYNAGSAVFLEGASTVANCVFSRNVSASDNQSLLRGGYTYTRGAVLVASGGEVRLSNSTFHNNRSSGVGAAVSSEGSLQLINNIFWFLDPPAPGPDDIPQNQMIHVGKGPDSPVGDPVARISNRLYPLPSSETINVVKGGVSGMTSEANAEIDLGADPGQTLIGTDPGFSDPANPAGPDGIWRTADDGFRLQSSSPAKDLGLSSHLPADAYDLDHDGNLIEPLPIDLVGYDRVQGTETDLGAYESSDVLTPGSITYSNWVSMHELTGDDLLSTANPSHDGVNNLIKYALGLDPMLVTLSPTDGENPGLPQFGLDGGTATFLFIKDSAKSDLTYTVETCTSFSNWSPVTAEIEEIQLSGTLIRVLVSIPLSNQTFFRLKIASREGL